MYECVHVYSKAFRIPGGAAGDISCGGRRWAFPESERLRLFPPSGAGRLKHFLPAT